MAVHLARFRIRSFLWKKNTSNEIINHVNGEIKNNSAFEKIKNMV